MALPHTPPARYRPARRHQVYQARRSVRRWSAWFIPPAVLLPVLLLMHVDQSLVALCMLVFPIVIIRLVQSWNDYQVAREETSRLV